MNYLGCSGWSYDHWIGEFYPKNIERNQWLIHYAKYFNTVEINMSFYRFPWPNMVKGWYNKTPKDFKFTFKANRQITHIKKLKNVKTLINRFYKLTDLMKEKLGCILWQFPPSLRLDLKKLQKFCKDLNTKYNNIIEFRHNSWYCQDVYKLLNKNNIGYCIVSAPQFPEDVHVTSNIAYIRFHGKQWYRYDYSQKELKQWAKIVKNLKTKDVYVYFNNDFNAFAVKNCLQLKKLLS